MYRFRFVKMTRLYLQDISSKNAKFSYKDKKFLLLKDSDVDFVVDNEQRIV